MKIEKMINLMLFHTDIKKADLAKKFGVTHASISSKISRGKMPVEDIEQIAEACNCKFVYKFILPDGKEITSED